MSDLSEEQREVLDRIVASWHDDWKAFLEFIMERTGLSRTDTLLWLNHTTMQAIMTGMAAHREDIEPVLDQMKRDVVEDDEDWR